MTEALMYCEILYLIEIILQFFTAYKDSENFENVYNLKKIAKEYVFNGSFFIHFIAFIPWTFLMPEWKDNEVVEQRVRHYLLIKMLRLVSILNVQDALPDDMILRIFQYCYGNADRDEKIAYDRQVLNIFKILWSVLNTVIITYLLGLIWFRLSDNWQAYLTNGVSTDKSWVVTYNLKIDPSMVDNPSYVFVEPSDSEKLITCMYYALTTLSTVGYGDFRPQTVVEKIFGSII
jgi:potassium channel